MTTYPYRSAAREIWEAGENPGPIEPMSKRSIVRGWQQYCAERMPRNVMEGFANSPVPHGIALALGWRGLVAIDVDTNDPILLRHIIEVLPTITVAKRGERGFTAFYRATEDTILTRRLGIVEILSRGTQTVIPPSIHPKTGNPFIWLDPAALQGDRVRFVEMFRIPDFGSLTSFDVDDANRLFDTVSKLTGRRTTMYSAVNQIDGPAQPLGEHELDRYRRYFGPAYRNDLAALSSMVPNSGRNNSTYRFTCRFGRLVHHGLVSRSKFVSDVIAACTTNGLISDDGVRAVSATINSGLRASSNDNLPKLGGGHV